MAAGATLVLKIIADITDAQKGLAEVGKTTNRVAGKVAGAASKLALPAGVAVGALGALAGQAAEDQQEQGRLTQAIKTAGAATGDYTKQVDDAVKSSQDRAFSDSESRDALVTLVGATGNVTDATGLLATSQDIARRQGVDLATAADAVAKAHAGQDTALTRLIPGLTKGKDATETLANAQLLAAGQADTYAASTVGQTAIMADTFAELGETIGLTLLPVLTTLTELMLKVGKFLTDNAPLASALAIAVGLIAGAILAVNIAMSAYAAISTIVTAGQWLLNAALAANPIGLIVIAILLLIGVLALAWANSQTFRDIVLGVFDAVKRAIDGAVTFIKGLFDGLVAILAGPFTALQTTVGIVLAAVQTIVEGVIAALGTIFDGFKTALGTIFGALKDVLAAPFTFLQETVKAVVDAVLGLVRGLAETVNGIFKGIGDTIGGIKDAIGGIHLPFAVVPAGGGTAPRVAGLRAGRAAVGQGPITVNVYTQADSIAAEQAVVRALRRVTRLNGGQVAAVGWTRG